MAREIPCFDPARAYLVPENYVVLHDIRTTWTIYYIILYHILAREITYITYYKGSYDSYHNYIYYIL